MSGETLLKADKDFTKEVDKVLPEAQQLAKVRLPIILHARN
jgi:26S proteasome regulatory subunit N5